MLSLCPHLCSTAVSTACQALTLQPEPREAQGTPELITAVSTECSQTCQPLQIITPPQLPATAARRGPAAPLQNSTLQSHFSLQPMLHLTHLHGHGSRGHLRSIIHSHHAWHIGLHDRNHGEALLLHRDHPCNDTGSKVSSHFKFLAFPPPLITPSFVSLPFCFLSCFSLTKAANKNQLSVLLDHLKMTNQKAEPTAGSHRRSLA